MAQENGKIDLSVLESDGLTIKELFGQKHGLTYDDIIILPGHIGFGVESVELNTKLTRKISLSMPLVFFVLKKKSFRIKKRGSFETRYYYSSQPHRGLG